MNDWLDIKGKTVLVTGASSGIGKAMNDWLNIKGKTVLVTGASSGIGKAIVEELLELGVNVANFDLSDNDLRHPNLLFVKVDVTSRSEVEEGVAKIVERFGNIDAVVNNAGINIPRLLIDAENPKGPYELDDETFEKVTMINQKGLYLVSQAVGRILVKNGKGVIVNMASEAGLEGSEGQSAYAATMEATGLRTLSYEEALAYTRGKTVEDIRAGYASTSTTPLGRSGKLREVADLVAFYISDRSSYITGVTTNIAGGKTRG